MINSTKYVSVAPSSMFFNALVIIAAMSLTHVSNAADANVSGANTVSTVQVPEFNILRFELGGGVTVAPSFEGSSRYEATPSFTFRLKELKWQNIDIGGDEVGGFSIAPSFRYLNERNASDDPILAGIEDIDASLELGLRASYEWQNARIFAQARYGVTGHNGLVGEAGADIILRPDEQLTFSIGPRISFGNTEYNDTFFSVPTTALNLQAFEAEGGLKSAGVESAIRYDFSDTWAIESSVEWSRLVGDAAASPIVQAGERDQIIAKFGIIRKFDLQF